MARKRKSKLLAFTNRQRKHNDAAIKHKRKEPVLSLWDEVPPGPSKTRDIEIPPTLLTKTGTVTKASLAKGTFQKNVIAVFAPYLIPEAMNALRRSMRDNNIQAIRTTLEQYGVISPNKGTTNIFAPQLSNTNLSRAEAVAAAAAEAQAKKVSGPMDFEHVLRILDEERPSLEARNRETMPTPEGPAGE